VKYHMWHGSLPDAALSWELLLRGLSGVNIGSRNGST
jgi:hypothetical protein